MVNRFVRLSFNRRDLESLIIEYGEWKTRGLTEEEKEEVQHLEAELSEFKDFTTAEELLEDDRREIMNKKKRLEQLQALTTEGQVVWIPQDRNNIDSIFLMISPERLPIYVENLPEELLKKILEPQFTLNVTPYTGPTPINIVPDDVGGLRSTSQDTVKTEILGILRRIPSDSADGREWEELVIIRDDCPAVGEIQGFITDPESVYVLPVQFLQNDWEPINEAFKSHFAARLTWHTAKKFSHWKVKR